MAKYKITPSLFKKLPAKMQLFAIGAVIIIVILAALWPQQFGFLDQLFQLSPPPPASKTDTDGGQTSGEQRTTTIETVSGKFYPVTKVSDGDTIRIEVDGQEQAVRLIGIDTPELVDPRKTVECFAKEASARTKDLLEGQKVRVENDSSQGNSDAYGRLLRYVYTSDGKMVNLLLIEQGYAFEYTYNQPYRYQSAFKSAQVIARTDERGLWAASSCGGQRQLEK